MTLEHGFYVGTGHVNRIDNKKTDKQQRNQQVNKQINKLTLRFFNTKKDDIISKK